MTLALGELAQDRATPLVGGRTLRSRPVVRKVAVDALAPAPVERREDPRCSSRCAASCRGRSRDRQRMAAEALGALGDAPSVPRLIELVKHDDAQVQGAARNALPRDHQAGRRHQPLALARLVGSPQERGAAGVALRGPRPRHRRGARSRAAEEAQAPLLGALRVPTGMRRSASARTRVAAGSTGTALEALLSYFLLVTGGCAQPRRGKLVGVPPRLRRDSAATAPLAPRRWQDSVMRARNARWGGGSLGPAERGGTGTSPPR